jgi:outer membrane receptor protein involved in Fe transport
VRHIERDTFNGDEAELSVCQDGVESVLCDEDGQPVLSEQGRTIPTELAFDGLVNTTQTVTDGYGGSLQLTFEHDLAARDNQLVVGTSYDGGSVAFLQRAETAFLTEERTVLGQGDFLGGDEFRTRLGVDNRYVGVYATDTFSLADPLALHVSGRLNWARLELEDRGVSNALDGKHDFLRVNPSAGVTYTPLDELTVFASYGESNRAPSAAELACADPDEPCRLPNAFIADPPLEQVVSRSAEVGLRGQLVVPRGTRPPLRWSAAGFGARNYDDIIFVAGSRVGTGYFRNAGRTQRIGVEVDLSGDAGPIGYFLGYSLLRATFETALSLPGGANPGAAPAQQDDEAAAIAVERGDRIPGLPTHSLKAGVAVSPVSGLRIGVSAIARSSAPFRGDEANLIEDLDGYAILSAHASYQLLDNLQLFLKAQNLLDAEYETFGLLADASEVIAGAEDPRFVGPGAPLAVFGGLVLHQ